MVQEQRVLGQLGQREAAVRALWTGRFHSISDVARAVEILHPGVADAATVWRYLRRPPQKLDHAKLTAIADVLECSVDELETALRAKGPYPAALSYAMA